MLVALRRWHEYWRTGKCTVATRSANMEALAMGSKMRIKASPLIAKELVLLFRERAFEPRLCEHLPGLTRVLVDRLSRAFELEPSRGCRTS